jgi:hypothetical protein
VGTRKILLIDDPEITLQLECAGLEALGAKVDELVESILW